MNGTTAARRTRLRDLGHHTVYVLAELPLALARFCVLPMAVVGVVLFVTGIGLPILVSAALVAGALARMDRRRLALLRGRDVARPTYRAGPPWEARQFTDVRSARAVIADPVRVREWLHGVLSLPVAFGTFMVAYGWWVVAITATAAPLYQWSLPDAAMTVGDLAGFDSAVADVASTTAVGLVFLVTLPPVMRGLAGVHAAMAQLLLTPRRVDVLASRVTQLAESRDAAVSAESDSLRRLERDIHDGPQQRLVRLAMDLSTVRRRLGTDPESAAPLVDEALRQTREALDELRALSRGIAPPILVDRGLAAALAALAGRSPVRTEVDVDLPEGTRLDRAVETAAYFVCAEALANVAKHSQASRCTIAVARSAGAAPDAVDTHSGTLVHVIVTDDGIGGAHAAKGHGIAGLADRVRAIGGALRVESPAGGPTVVSAELPCGS